MAAKRLEDFSDPIPANGPTHAVLRGHLIEHGKLSEAAADRAERAATEGGEAFPLVLAKLGLVTDRDLAEAYREILRIPLLTLAEFPDEPILEAELSRRFLKEVRCLPMAIREDYILVAMVDPLDEEAVQAISFSTGKPVLRRIALPADYEAAYERLYGDGRSEIAQIAEAAQTRYGDGTEADIERLKDGASDAPVIRLVNLLITRAVEARASDIHLEPTESELRVRYRIDGVLHDIDAAPQALSAPIISRVKIMARLNIAERRLAQDGRIRIAIRGKDIDFRVSTTPALHGESVVLRILDRSGLKLDFLALGFEKDLVDAFRGLLAHPHGIVLVTGPTGNGKTTTLYTALLEINTPDKKILTIEDPIEYQLKGINQVQVKPQIGLTFANALRSFLRQDPDIMMVGEIRDLETAQIAVQAALTGHLILSTLHTNDAPSAVARLLDMGVEDYLLTSTINGIAAQRLVRKLCPQCREAYEPLPDLIHKLQLERLSEGAAPKLYRAIGCSQCSRTGYFGRSCILEILPMSDEIRQLILQHAEAARIRKAAIGSGMQPMHLHGMRKCLAGITTAEEVLRATRME